MLFVNQAGIMEKTESCFSRTNLFAYCNICKGHKRAPDVMRYNNAIIAVLKVKLLVQTVQMEKDWRKAKTYWSSSKLIADEWLACAKLDSGG